jgi:hypothetical protein
VDRITLFACGRREGTSNAMRPWLARFSILADEALEFGQAGWCAAAVCDVAMLAGGIDCVDLLLKLVEATFHLSLKPFRPLREVG